MFKLFSKGCLAALVALLSLSAVNSSLMACGCSCSSACNRFYVGAFGGGIYSEAPRASQMGTAFFPEVGSVGPLAIFAQGRMNKSSAGFGGAQIGYEWAQCPIAIGCSSWSLAPAAELETYFYSNNKTGHLIDPATRLPEHDFVDSFRLNMSVCLVNAVLSLHRSCACRFSPYIGGGIGATHISLRNADSLQVAPPEAGVNHFNSRRSDTTWAFAAQVKAGLRYKICRSLHAFGEYRYLFVDASNYILGSTVAPNHPPTSPWNVKVNSYSSNAFAVGLQYDL